MSWLFGWLNKPHWQQTRLDGLIMIVELFFVIGVGFGLHFVWDEIRRLWRNNK